MVRETHHDHRRDDFIYLFPKTNDRQNFTTQTYRSYQIWYALSNYTNTFVYDVRFYVCVILTPPPMKMLTSRHSS